MYRTAAKRLLGGARYYYSTNFGLRCQPPQKLVLSSRFFTSEPQPFPDPHSINRGIPVVTTTEAPISSDSASSSSSTEDGAANPKTNYEDQQARVLQASLPYVIKLGWTEAALIAGARDVGLSPSIVGSLSRKEAALVEYFMDDCLQRLVDKIESDESLKNLTPSDCISKLIRFRLEMQAPYISTWPQALSIQAQPANVPTSFKQRAVLVDEIWHAAGDKASDIDWYAKRTILGGIYSTTEIYMLTDSSPDFRDTWAFLDARVKDAFNIKKTIQEAQSLAEAVSVGLGNSFQGFFGKGFQR
ncbi:ubiquinone biosynthesis protein COQ9, mitochondrial [Vigna unguiculata]|uniref:Ubiquinone biosynthesis protein n=1 Tax=Vigna unguiculata TaxID=3917 RepID=A0A4D6KV07_VIGUN|nr:ubiquinone biosynthesis protein COQ9, mitochondrial [Vigna unguiculata]QCD80215.1 Ubiquinone biosynthesis protein [Vigna unguiculata]